MPIHALALLRTEKPATDLRVDQLEDAVIVHTGLAFSSEPTELSVALAAALPPGALAAHEDARGILFIPSVAAPSARSYEAVVEEVGEGGQWGPLVDEHGSASFVEDSAFADMLGNMLGQLPPSLLSSAAAAASGDRAALDAVGAQVQALMGSSPALTGLAQQLSGMLGQSAPQQPAAGEQLAALEQMFANFGAGEADQSVLREMVLGMQEELLRDPAKFEELARGLLGKDGPAK